MFEKKLLSLLPELVQKMESGFDDLPKFSPVEDFENIEPILMEVAERMRDNFPYAHPLYAGQMLKPPHPIARMAYTLSLWINPNNHALDGGRASSAMEKEAVAHIAEMFGWKTHLGHLCGGGTVANLEALWIASQLNPGKKVLASSQAHYTHNRICGVLKIPFESVPIDSSGRMDLEALKKSLDQGNIGTVVVTMGTTNLGAVDPLEEILRLQATYGFRIHADAAYGGYFSLCETLEPQTKRNYEHLAEVDSIVVDPHKHGLQPYGCGCVLFKNPEVGKFYKHDSPYTYFSSSDLHLGEISLECSRPGASAVALWATQKLLPLVPKGAFAEGLAKSRTAAVELAQRVEKDERLLLVSPPELDIVLWAPAARTAKGISELSLKLFQISAQNGLHLAITQVPKSVLETRWKNVEWDQGHVTVLRSCLLKPEHLEWLEPIWSRLQNSVKQALP